MKRTIHLAILLTIITGLAVSSAKAGKPVSGPVNTPLRVTLYDYDADGNLCDIRGDGSDYVNGVAGVVANFETDGNLAIRAIGPVGTARRVNFNFDEPLVGYPSSAFSPPDPAMATPLADANAAGDLAADSWYVVTYRTDQFATNGVAIQNMAIGDTKCILISTTFKAAGDASNTSYRMAYQRTNSQGTPPAADGSDQDGTAYGLVTRVDASTWTIVPGAGDCTPTAGLPENGPAAARVFETETVTVRNKATTTTTNRGRFNVRFKMTLTKL
jgi:hypothetical protein